MRITPLDIRKQDFKKSMRGLESEEVYAFLNTVADEYEAVLNDNKALRERLVELDDKVQEYRNMEKTLRDTLLTAERVTVEAKDNARREADLVIKEAQLEAEKMFRRIKTDAMKLRQEIQNLRRQRDTYLSRVKLLIESHLKFLEGAERDFAEEDRKLDDAAREPDADWMRRKNEGPGSGPRSSMGTPFGAPLRPAQPPASGPSSPPPEARRESPPESAAQRPVEALADPPDDGANPPALLAVADGEGGPRTGAEPPNLNEVLGKMIERRRAASGGDAAVGGAQGKGAQGGTASGEDPPPEGSHPGEWSLEQLKQDIISRRSKKREDP